MSNNQRQIFMVMYYFISVELAVKIREKESLECRMWTQATKSSLRLHNAASLHQQLSALEAGTPLTKSWIRTWWNSSISIHIICFYFFKNESINSSTWSNNNAFSTLFWHCEFYILRLSKCSHAIRSNLQKNVTI